jgi:thymidylate kinase
MIRQRTPFQADVAMDTQGQPVETFPITSPLATKGQLLRELFSAVHKEGLVYAVLRNYEGLPEKPGRDVDILTKDFENFKKIIEQVSQKAGYSVRVFRHYDCLVKFHLIPGSLEAGDVLEIDVGWDIRWKGIPLIPQDLVDHSRLWKDEFFSLRPGPEAAITLTKDLIYSGVVKDKYKPVLPKMVGMDRDGFLETLMPCFGEHLSARVAELTTKSDWINLQSLVPQLRRQAVSKSLNNNLLTQLGLWATFLWSNSLKFFRPSGRFLVLIGPDGSGKSTVAEALQQSQTHLFQGTRCYHAHFRNLPRLRDLAQLLGFKLSEETNSDQPAPQKISKEASIGKKIKSFFSLIYYALDYVLGYPIIFRSRGQGQLIIFDRYYYDYLIQRGMSLPDWFLNLVLRIIPKPDMVVYLKNNPEVIRARKPELSRDELERQGKICAKLISRLSNGYTVETIGTPADTTASVLRILSSKIINEV